MRLIAVAGNGKSAEAMLWACVSWACRRHALVAPEASPSSQANNTMNKVLRLARGFEKSFMKACVTVDSCYAVSAKKH